MKGWNKKRLWVNIHTTYCVGLGAAKVRIWAYRATGEVDTLPRTDNTEVAITLGTRLLLTCDVTGLSENNVVVSYRWFWSCVGGNQGRCEIRDGDPYYRVVNDTLLVDVTSLDHGKRYYCVVKVSNCNASATSTGFTAILTMKGKCMQHKMLEAIHYKYILLLTNQVALLWSSTPPPPSSPSTLSSLMYNRQQGGMDNSG